MVERSTLKAAVTAVIVILILTYVGMKIRLGVYNKRIAVSQFELNTLALQTEEVTKQAFLARVLQQRIYWSDALKEIANLIPKQIRLTGMHIHKQVLNLKGEIKSPGLPEEKVLTEFMSILEEGIFQNVTLVTTKKGLSADEPYTFELRLTPEIF